MNTRTKNLLGTIVAIGMVVTWIVLVTEPSFVGTALQAMATPAEHSHLETLGAMLLFNMLPFFIALGRRHHSKIAILVTLLLVDVGMVPAMVFSIVGIGFFLGFILMLVWFGTLIWSFSGNTQGRDERLAKIMAQQFYERAE